MRILSSITADREVLDNADHVAMNQEELQDLLVNPPETIYLVGGPFSIPSAQKSIRYVGVNQPEVMLEKGKLIADYNAAGISLKDVRYTSPYRCTEAEQLFLTGRFAEALPLLEDATGQGNPRAMYMVAMCYEHGLGTYIDMKRCREWLQRSFGMKEPISSMNYAYFCCTDRNRKAQILSEYADELQALALSGDNLAQFEFWHYVLWNRGKYTAEDCAQAIEGFRNAAEQGFAPAQEQFVTCYYFGYGVAQDCAEAVNWYRKAAAQGHADAQWHVGIMYEHGHGVEQDYTKAAEWYRKAAEQGHVWAQMELGELYAYGHGVAKDDAKAAEWFRKAAEQEDAGTQFQFGAMYQRGHSVAQDYAKAVDWYRKAAEQGLSRAQCQLGIMYERGLGVEKDNAQAIEWYRKAAKQGYSPAQDNLRRLGS